MKLPAKLQAKILLTKYLKSFALVNKIVLKNVKINILLYIEFSNYEDIEEIDETKKIKINWLYLLHVIFKLLMFPVLLAIGCAFTYKPNNKRR